METIEGDELLAAALLCSYLEGYADQHGEADAPDLTPALLVDHWQNATPEQRRQCLGLARAYRRVVTRVRPAA